MRTYGRFYLEPANNCWVIAACEPHVAIRLKQLFPRIPKATGTPYFLDNTPSMAADLEWFVSRYPLEGSAEDLASLTNGRLAFEQHQLAIERIFAPDYLPPSYAGLREGQGVRLYQAQAVEMLRRSGGLLLGDDVGLGKTYTAAAACLTDGALPAVVVCQGHLQKQWCEVIEKFTTLRAVPIKVTKPHELPRADVYVFRYTQIAGWADVFETLAPGLAVFDEIQELRTGPASQKGCAAIRLRAAAAMALGLSATPIYNYGLEIYNIMLALNATVLGEREDFFREWCSGGHIGDPKALGTYLREQHAFLRRTKADVGQQMPAVNRIVDSIDYDPSALESVESLARQLATRAATGTFVERGQAARELDVLIRHQTGVAKAERVADFTRIIVEGGEPVVLMGWHRDVYDIWLEKLHDLRPVLYTGSESNAQKNKSKEAFIHGDTDLFIMSLRSGAGLDGLQFRSSTMIFGELDWSPGVHHQNIGRLDREGQTNPVTAIFLVTEEGSDPPMMEVLGLKASEASAIVDPSLGVQAAHSDVSHLQRLVQQYLSRGAAMEPRQDLFAGAAG